MLLKILTAVVFLAFGLVIYSVATLNPLGVGIKTFISSTPHADKCIHFLMMATFALLLNGSMRHRKVSLGGWQILFGSLLVGFAITLEECSQAFIPSRNFELMDMLCNYAGIYVGSLVKIPAPKPWKYDRHGGKAISLQAIFHSSRPVRHEGRHGRRAARRLG